MSNTETYPTPPSKWRSFENAILIHLFALAHAVVAIASRSMDYYDDVPLTILTLSMVVIISIRHRLQIEIMAIVTLVSSFVGFLMGVYGALFIRTLIRSDLWAPALATFLVTELIGWGTCFVARSRNNSQRIKELNQNQPNSQPITSIALIAGTILLLRVGYMLILRHYYADEENIYTELAKIFSNTFALLMLICGNLICTNLYIGNKEWFRRRRSKLLWIIGSVTLVALVTTFCIQAAPWILYNTPMSVNQFVRMFVVVLLLSIAAYAILFLGHYVVSSQRELSHERRQRHFAQYQYNRFKEQINPHFLFNSLNILDSLVQEGERERASTFIRKLAGIYRYMLHNEEESLVTLREEMAFAEMYIDLIKERFTNGLEIHREIPSDRLTRMVVPCSVQQLIENATKHNIVSSDEPLHITIQAQDEWLSVENNRQPRISSRNASTHLGLKSISQQFSDVSGLDIRITATDEIFRVELPLLKPTKA